MTFAVGIRVREGLVALADTHVVVGGERSLKAKLSLVDHLERPVFVMTSGLRAVSDKVVLRVQDDLASRPQPFDRLHELTTAFGEHLRRVHEEDGPALRAGGLTLNTHMVIGGQLGGDRQPELFHVYPEGNWVVATEDAPCFVIGRSPYGKPILDRLLRYETAIELAATVAYLAFDATRASSVDVGFPIDVLIADAREPTVRRYHATDFEAANAYWNERLHSALAHFPLRWTPPTTTKAPPHP
jgi:putative proteasome-type protease